MTTVAYSARALGDLGRLAGLPAAKAAEAARAAVEAIVDAVSVLPRHPFIGRVGRGHLRELTISRGRTAYVALYRFVAQKDRMEILAIRHQREAGYA